jgi:hypothetical protein
MVTPSHLWSLDELAARVAAALAIDSPGAVNGRIREVPDVRAIRYYTTLGILDRPAQMKGRTAFYGPRHLRQLVAIKRLQAKGMPLARVQQELAGIGESALTRLASVPDAAFADHVAPIPVAEPALVAPPATPPLPARRAGNFWAAPPASVVAGILPDQTVSDGAPPGEAAVQKKKAEIDVPQTPGVVSPAPVQGVKLGDRVMLLFEGARPPTNAEMAALSTAAAPLLEALEKLGLVVTTSDEKDKP